MKVKSNKTKIVVLTILVLIVVLVFLFFKNYVERNNLISQLELMGCTFISSTRSKEKEFDKDIFLNIPYKPVDSVVHSNQTFYENLIKTVALKLKNRNFRLIDPNKELIVSIKNQDGELKYTINGNNNYYETEMARLSKNNSKEKIIQMSIKSHELETIIQNNWNMGKSRSQLGTKEKNKGDYECYTDEGFNIRIVNLKVFNIVFNKQYKNEVFEGITTGLNNNEIVEKLGEPLFQSDAKPEIGYKTKDYYIFFYNGEISIYRIEEFDELKNKEFAELVTKLIEDENLNEFINKITDIYPDFDRYSKSEDGIEILYSLRGFSISYSKNGNKGITIYNNFKGNITQNINCDEIGFTKSLPRGFYYFDMDSVYQNELKREN